MEYAFTDVFDIPALTKLCQSFTDIDGVVTALLDLDGKVHVATGWQDVCTQFHRKNPATACRCTESDTFLAGQLEQGCEYNVYRCKNGLVDVAVPVMVNGKHVANFFTGQFFFEPPDLDYFAQQAKEFGFDESAYLEALRRAPVYSEEHIKVNLAFLVKLTQVIGEMGEDRLAKLEANKQLAVMATTDSLTGIPNRAHFIEKAKHHLQLAARNGSPLTLLMMDLDHFKDINDAHGHQAGDAVLQAFAAFVRTLVRKSDVFGRVGGEEFCVVLQNTDEKGGAIFAERLRRGVEALRVPFNGQRIGVTVSIGLARLDGDDNFQSLFSKADQAMYRAKAQGRNRMMRYDQAA
ncbi:MAG: diguanylate cyclase [Rhodocyclaceae bacterium]|nr:diguanylate cyclase [Rhodocyclaceae bacterium]